ncbi:hypothetical protein Pme01_47870 [Planosporangium mesophilum]|uniref:Uncharacterized protein n=2 Tax=Planosporangium mesophilum TaxID=689768 RepID=A0A8J3X282_9ACTN|nr:hypothetical protein Pme01_47870 [Planosporangium mesophilum]
MRIDLDVLAEWSRTLDRLPPLASQLRLESPSTSAGSAAHALHRVSAAGMVALVEVAESLDRLTERLRSGVATAAAGYSRVDDHAASVVDCHVR